MEDSDTRSNAEQKLDEQIAQGGMTKEQEDAALDNAIAQETMEAPTKAYNDFGEILKDESLSEEDKMEYLNMLIPEEKQELSERDKILQLRGIKSAEKTLAKKSEGQQNANSNAAQQAMMAKKRDNSR